MRTGNGTPPSGPDSRFATAAVWSILSDGSEKKYTMRPPSTRQYGGFARGRVLAISCRSFQSESMLVDGFGQAGGLAGRLLQTVTFNAQKSDFLFREALNLRWSWPLSHVFISL
jgi:hypothetical protein